MRVYFEDNGVGQIREVPEDADPKTYKWGILVGPPDMSELALPARKIKELVKALALAGFGNYRDTQGRRSEMFGIISKVTEKRDKTILRHILHIYQREYLEG